MKKTANTQTPSREAFEAALAEYTVMVEEQRTYFRQIHRNTQILLTFVGGLVAVGLSGSAVVDIQFVDAVVPSLLFVFLLIHVSHFHTANMLGKRRAQIELLFQSWFQEEVTTWESQFAPKVITPVASPTFAAALLLLLTTLGVFGVFSWRAYETWGTVSLAVHIGESLILLTLFGWAGLISWKTEPRPRRPNS